MKHRITKKKHAINTQGIVEKKNGGGVGGEL